MPSSLGYLVLLVLGVVLRPGPVTRASLGSARWIPGLLSLLALVVGVEQVVLGVRGSGAGAARLAVLPLVALMLAGLFGRAVGLQRWINSQVATSAGLLSGPDPLTESQGFKVVLVFLGLNPIGWLAGFMAGASGDWRPLAWKTGLDLVTLLTLTKGDGRSLFGGVLASALVHLGFEGLGLWGGQFLERADLVGVGLVTAGVVWVVVPMLVLRVRKVPLASMVLAVPIALALGWFWR